MFCPETEVVTPVIPVSRGTPPAADPPPLRPHPPPTLRPPAAPPTLRPPAQAPLLLAVAPLPPPQVVPCVQVAQNYRMPSNLHQMRQLET